MAEENRGGPARQPIFGKRSMTVTAVVLDPDWAMGSEFGKIQFEDATTGLSILLRAPREELRVFKVGDQVFMILSPPVQAAVEQIKASKPVNEEEPPEEEDIEVMRDPEQDGIPEITIVGGAEENGKRGTTRRPPGED